MDIGQRVAYAIKECENGASVVDGWTKLSNTIVNSGTFFCRSYRMIWSILEEMHLVD